jgi:hypothetical protein
MRVSSGAEVHDGTANEINKMLLRVCEVCLGSQKKGGNIIPRLSLYRKHR